VKIYLLRHCAATGQEPDAFLADIREQAAKQVKADLALRALALAEAIEVDESDLDEEIVRLADQSKTTPARLREVLERDGRLPGLRSQLKNAKALAWLVEHVSAVDEEGNPLDRSMLRSEEHGGADAPAETGMPEGIGE
jgi:FKBP-type peptidyl-prolyl cis-trans isomerase (trigger factor)